MSCLGYKHTDEAKKKISESSKRFRGHNHPSWKGGKIEASDGYIYIWSPTHPNKTKMGYVCEHRLVIEKKIKRFLDKHEHVHHINKIKDDNRLENLALTTSHEHKTKYHKDSYVYTEQRRQKQKLASLKRKRDIFGKFLSY